MIKADITYPDAIPLPLLSSNNRQNGQTFIRGESRTGLASQRRGFTFQCVEMGFEIIVNQSDAFIFENFYFHGLNDGVKWFNIKRLTHDGLKEVQARFIEPYSFTALKNDLFKYTSRIEVFSDD